MKTPTRARVLADLPAFLALLMLPGLLWAQSIVDWTEGPGRLGLGYPVPVPVDTPLPFDGFRTYAGLHTRHQDLAMGNDTVLSAIVGQTRNDRDIWAYRIGRGGDGTWEGLPRAALQFTGGIHAREWQSPEVVTGLMEFLVDGQGNGDWIDYVLDHSSIVAIPVLNIDGFLQTQRYPRSNWLGVDNRFPDDWPRDGRMRRKNLRGSDESLTSPFGRLTGVDLNRNNEPAFPGPPDTGNPNDLTYRGTAPASEPETQALIAATEMGPAEQLRFYSDMHSYARLLFSVQTRNARLNNIQSRVLDMASRHHRELPGNVRYVDDPSNVLNGIGTTSEYFADRYQVPALTWEIEPGQQGGTEYGGFGTNGHDGFILPESEITRVRTQLAETLTAVAYHMSGPPRIVRADLLGADGESTLWSGRWQTLDDGSRQRVVRRVAPIEPGRDYRLRVTFDKPMRWRENDQVAPFPGQSASALDIASTLVAEGEALDATFDPPTWGDEPYSWIGARPSYRDNTLEVSFRVADTAANDDLIAATHTGMVGLSLDVRDLTGQRLDADPATPALFENGYWVGYEGELVDQGGPDGRFGLEIDPGNVEPVLPVGAWQTANWFNPERAGEGWMLEILPDKRALAYWFTFDEDGNPRWLIGTGTVVGNRIEFPELITASGARFGEAFDADDVVYETVGSARMIFSDCDTGWYEYEAFGLHRTVDFQALTSTWGTNCGSAPEDVDPRADLSGSWYDPEQAGQGLTLQWVSPDSMLLVWFTYDQSGNPFWIIGQSEAGSTDPIVFPELLTVRGPRFGDAFDPDAREQSIWGAAELQLDCAQGRLDYSASLDGFEDGSLPLSRLTELTGLGDCAALTAAQ
jgi:hypothetical protein